MRIRITFDGHQYSGINNIQTFDTSTDLDNWINSLLNVLFTAASYDLDPEVMTFYYTNTDPDAQYPGDGLSYTAPITYVE